MKKTTVSFLITMILTICIILPVSAAEVTLVNKGGIELHLLKWETYDTTDSPRISMELRGVNNTAHKIWVDFKDVKVDGVPVLSTTRSIAAYTDTGNDDPLLYSVWGGDDDNGAGSEAIRNGHKLEILIDVTDNDTYEHLVSENVVIDLTVKSETKTPQTSSSGASYAPSYTPASYDFVTLKIGSKGQAVRDLQQRLTDLGYMNDKVDGSFGKITGTAVMSFCTQNGLYIQGDATPEMQSLLYSSGAQYYEEPWVPLIIGPQYRWNNPIYADLDNGVFYAQVVNRSSTRTIRGYELYYYFTDVWGERYKGPGSDIELTRRTTVQQTIQPGYIVDTDPITVYPFSWTYNVNIGIHKIVFDDGEIREIDEDDIQYFECTIKN